MIDVISIPEERAKLLRKNKKFLEFIEESCNVKISVKENEIWMDGDPIEILRIKEVFRAFGRGFSWNDSLNLLDENYFLEIINVKDYAKSRNRIIELKGRVIGTKGKIKRIIERETNTKISIYGKTISIIGKIKNVRTASKVIRAILEGKKHGTALKILEEKRE